MYYIKQNEVIKIEDGCDNIAVLAPCMYWFVKKSFPFDSKRKIEKIILKSAQNSVDFVENVFCYKQEEEYVCFAYNLNALKKRLSTQGLEIDKIYFISSFYAPQRDIRVSSEVVLCAMAETFFESSSKTTHEVFLHELSFENTPCVTFAKSDYMEFQIAALVLLVLGFIMSAISWNMQGNYLEEQEKRITMDNYRLDALIRKYETTQTTQSQLREAIVQAASMSSLKCRGVSCEVK
jgi:hypothetical protein